MSFDTAWNNLKKSRYVEEQGNPGHPIPFNTILNRLITDKGGDPQKVPKELKIKMKNHILSSPQTYGLNALHGFDKRDYKDYQQSQKEVFQRISGGELATGPVEPPVEPPVEDLNSLAFDPELNRRRPPSDATGPAQPRDNKKFKQSRGPKMDRLDRQTIWQPESLDDVPDWPAGQPAETKLPDNIKDLNKFIFRQLGNFKGTREQKNAKWKEMRDNLAGQLNIPLPGERKKVEKPISNLVANPILPKEVIQQDIDMARNRHSPSTQMTLDSFNAPTPKAAEERGAQSLLNKPILPTSTSKVAPAPPPAEQEIRRITQPGISEWSKDRRRDGIQPITQDNPGISHTDRLNQLLAQVQQQQTERFPGESKLNLDENGNMV